MLAEIQINKTEHRVYAMNEYGKTFATFVCGTSFFPGYNEYGQLRGNADDGVFVITGEE